MTVKNDLVSQTSSAVRRLATALGVYVALVFAVIAAPAGAQPSFIAFESGHVRPVAMTPNGKRLVAVNTPDNSVEVYTVAYGGYLVHLRSIPVGMEPVAVAARSDSQVWVVNHLSDSVSIVDIDAGKVTRTLIVGDEPRDIVFAGTGVKSARVSRAVTPYDIASTMANILEIEAPSGSVGEALFEVLPVKKIR